MIIIKLFCAINLTKKYIFPDNDIIEKYLEEIDPILCTYNKQSSNHKYKYKIALYDTRTQSESIASSEMLLFCNPIDINNLTFINFTAIYDPIYNQIKLYRTKLDQDIFFTMVYHYPQNSLVINISDDNLLDPYIEPYFYTTFNSSNIINYKIIRIPVNNFVPNLNNFISHSTDLLYTNQKMISDLNDYIFNKSFILLNNIASFDSINDPKTVLNASLIYLYNINFKCQMQYYTTLKILLSIFFLFLFLYIIIRLINNNAMDFLSDLFKVCWMLYTHIFLRKF